MRICLHCQRSDRPFANRDMCKACYNREWYRQQNGQVGPFTCPDCGVETGRAFKDWSGVRCAECRASARLAAQRRRFQTPEGKSKSVEYRKRYGRTERDKAREKAYKARPEVKERERVRRSTRHAVRKAQAEEQLGSVSPDIRQRLFEAQGGKCAACLKRIKGTPELDHIVPLSKGGMHDDANFQILCKPCNTSKHNRDPVEWAQSKGRLF